MGSGKSTVGKIISSELFLNFFDTDEEIENRTGASIDWIFDLEGEDGFRKRESKILEDMAQNGQDPQLTFLKHNMLLSGHFYETLGQKLNVWQQC